METFWKENIAARDGPALDQLLDLLNNFGRTKLSLNSLLVRPVWRERVRQQLRDSGAGDDGNYTEEQFSHWLPIFYRLSRQLQHQPAGQPMRVVAEIIGVPLSTATRFVDGLVKNDLLERHPDAQDRRVVLVQLTSKGQRVYGVVDRAIRELVQEMLSQFTPEERQQLLHLGTRLYDLLQASLEEVTPVRKESQAS